MADRFDKFTVRARNVLQLAQEEAQRLNHSYIGTEHLLLGLVREGEGVAAKVLSNMGVELKKVRDSIEFIVGRGDFPGGSRGLTPRAKRVIELSVDEARRLQHRYIGTEHLLLGLVREGEGVASGVLVSLGVSLDSVRSQVLQLVEQSIPASVGFTPAAHSAVDHAQLAARWYEHDQVDTEHLLVGLVRQRNGLAARVLSDLGVDRRRLMLELDASALGEPREAAPIVGFTTAAQAAMERARLEAQHRSQTPVGTGHLLLGALSVPDSHAARLLEQLGITVHAVRAALEPRVGEQDTV